MKKQHLLIILGIVLVVAQVALVIFNLDKQKLDKVLKIFYIVCVLEIFPDLNKWADMTEEILK